MVDFSRLLVANVKLVIVKIHLWKVLLVGYLILVVIQLHPVHHQQQRQQQQQPQPQPQPTSARNREATQRVVLRKSSLFHLQLFIALYALSLPSDHGNKISMTNILLPTMIHIIGTVVVMAVVMVVTRIYTIITDQRQSKFLNFNIHLIRFFNKTVSLSKFI